MPTRTEAPMKIRFPLLASFLLIFAAGPALAEDALRDQAKGLFEPIPETPPQLPGEATTPEKLALGKMLYFDPRISESHELSCAACHDLGLGGGDSRSSSIARGWQLAGRKSQTVLNAVFNKSFFYDGRASDLKDQVMRSVTAFPGAMQKTRGGPTIFNPAEPNAAKAHAVEQLKGIPGYVEAFKKAFPGEADPIVYENVARAIAVFETTLITPDAPFDLWLKGDDAALSDNQKQGLKLFIEKGCSNCHKGVNIGGGSYARFGVAHAPAPEILPTDDWGRYAVTKNLNDKYVFRVQGLRNVELNAPYFHSSHTWDLKKAVEIMADAQLGVKLSDDEAAKVTDFLKSLTGRQPEVVLPIMPPSVATTPRPQP
jgi:cytochrome c peroxidase